MTSLFIKAEYLSDWCTFLASGSSCWKTVDSCIFLSGLSNWFSYLIIQMHFDLMSFKHDTFHSTISSSQVSEMCFFSARNWGWTWWNPEMRIETYIYPGFILQPMWMFDDVCMILVYVSVLACFFSHTNRIGIGCKHQPFGSHFFKTHQPLGSSF